MKFGGTCYVARRLAVESELGAGGGKRPGEFKLPQVAVNTAARADALHDLLAQVATLVEVQRPHLRGLLGQVTLGYVDAVDGNALGNAEGIQRIEADRNGARGANGVPLLGKHNGRGGDPEFVAGNQDAVSAHHPEIQTVPLDARAGERFRKRGQAEPGQNLIDQRTRQSQRGLAVEGGQFHIVHDDEVFEVGNEFFVLIGGNLQFEFIAVAPDMQVAQDAPLRVEYQVPGAGIGGKVIDHVCNHAA